MLLDSLTLGEYKKIFREKSITGERLSCCEDKEDLIEFGISSKADARLLLKKLNSLKRTSG